MFEAQEESACMFDILCRFDGQFASVDHNRQRLTALTRARSYGDFLSCGEGSTRTVCSSLDSSLPRFTDVGSGKPEGDRGLTVAIICDFRFGVYATKQALTVCGYEAISNSGKISSLTMDFAAVV